MKKIKVTKVLSSYYRGKNIIWIGEIISIASFYPLLFSLGCQGTSVIMWIRLILFALLLGGVLEMAYGIISIPLFFVLLTIRPRKIVPRLKEAVSLLDPCFNPTYFGHWDAGKKKELVQVATVFLDTTETKMVNK